MQVQDNECFTDYLFRYKKSIKNIKQPSTMKKSTLSNSMPSFSKNLFKKEKSLQKTTFNKNTIPSLLTDRKAKIISKTKHSKCFSCEQCHNYNKILQKGKIQLSKYIENENSFNNIKYLKLFGNARYNENSPNLFVYDYKNKLSDKKMGLVPLPIKIKQQKNDFNKIYELQRSIVMARRLQYQKNTSGRVYSKNKEKKLFSIKLIQRWWRQLYKIIFIQKIYRGHCIRVQVGNIRNLYNYMKYFENLLMGVMLKKYFFKILKFSEYNYNNGINYIIKYDNSNKNFYTKKRLYSLKTKIDKIILIQRAFRKKQKSKFYIKRKYLLTNNKYSYYIDKYYFDIYSKKTIDFIRLMKHGLQLYALKRIHLKYKKPENYNKDDIESVKFIQKKFRQFFYTNIKIIRINKKRKKIGIYSKIKKINNDNQIKLIQKKYRQFICNKNNFNKNLIKIKSFLISLNQEVNKDGNKSNIITRNFCYITKKQIIDVNDKIILLQRKIYSFLVIKRLREQNKNKKYKKINKNFISNYFFTKIYSNKDYCIKKIIQIQTLYKTQYNYIKNNIIEYQTNSGKNNHQSNTIIKSNLKNGNIRQLPTINKKNLSKNKAIIYHKKNSKEKNIPLNDNNKNSSNERYITRFIKNQLLKSKSHFKRYTLRQLLSKNKIPRKNPQGYYISKKRVEKHNTENYLNFNINIIHKTIQKECFITKNRYINQIIQVIKIQNFYRNKIKLIDIIPFKKPLNIYEKTKKSNESYFENTPNSKKIKIPYEINNNTDYFFYHSSSNIKKDQNLLILNRYDADETSNKSNINENNISNYLNIYNTTNFPKHKNANTDYISKINKRIILIKPKLTKNCYISKIFNQCSNKNILFIFLLALFIKKNIEEYIYYILKYNTKINFNYPFYIKTLKRVIKFLQLKSNEKYKINKIFNKIFPNINNNINNKELIELIISITPEKNSILINSNIYYAIEPDFINFISAFSKYDKQITNEKFIDIRLKNSNLISTNIFNIIRFIDEEFNSLINGKYCNKCYLTLNKCNCFTGKKNNSSYDTESGSIEFDFLEKGESNYRRGFEYNSIKCKGAHIQRKPKIEEIYEDPITCLINKDEKNTFYSLASTNQFNSIESTGSSNNYNNYFFNKSKNNVGREKINQGNNCNRELDIQKIKEIYYKTRNIKNGQ